MAEVVHIISHFPADTVLDACLSGQFEPAYEMKYEAHTYNL